MLGKLIGKLVSCSGERIAEKGMNNKPGGRELQIIILFIVIYNT